MAHIGKGQTNQLLITNSSGAVLWVDPWRQAMSAVYAKAQGVDLVPQDCHKIVHGSFSVPDGTSLLLETDAKLVILDG